MQNNLQFNTNRFWHLVKNDLFTNFRTMLIAGGAAIGILLFINLISMLTEGEVLVPLVFYPLVLFIGGFIVTSQAFGDLHSPQRSYVYLTLPASNLEKLLSKLVLTTVGFVLGTLVMYFVFSLIMSLANLVFFGNGYQVFNPFDRVIWITIGIYTITQSLFLAGAVFFRKNALIKTVFTMFLLQLAFSIFMVFAARIIFWDFFQGFEFSFNHFTQTPLDLEDKLESFAYGFFHFIKFIFFWVLAPFFWYITYNRLKETEA